MLNSQLIWAAAVCLFSVVWLVVLLRRGPHRALGIAVVLTFLMPVWVKMPILGQDISCRTAIAAQPLP